MVETMYAEEFDETKVSDIVLKDSRKTFDESECNLPACPHSLNPPSECVCKCRGRNHGKYT